MEALFVHLMEWGQEQGYRWFVLGMAPLSGFEDSPVASLWNRVGAFLYQHGESVYNFQGLRGLQGQVQPRLGAALPGLPRRSTPAAHHGRRVGARGGRLPAEFFRK